MEKFELVSAGYGKNTIMKESKSAYNDRVTNFAARLITEIEKSNVLGGNPRTNAAVSACIMFDDTFNRNNSLMESPNFRSDLNAILLNISRVNEVTNVISNMNRTDNMFDCVRLFSSIFYGELHPEENLPQKMCFVDKIEHSLKKM